MMTQKRMFCHYLLTLMLVQTHRIFFLSAGGNCTLSLYGIQLCKHSMRNGNGKNTFGKSGRILFTENALLLLKTRVVEK